MDKSKIVPEIHRYMVCDLQAPMMLNDNFGRPSLIESELFDLLFWATILGVERQVAKI